MLLAVLMLKWFIYYFYAVVSAFHYFDNHQLDSSNIYLFIYLLLRHVAAQYIYIKL